MMTIIFSSQLKVCVVETVLCVTALLEDKYSISQHFPFSASQTSYQRV